MSRLELLAPIAAAGVLALLLSTKPAPAHDWYPYECCSDRDCRPLEWSEVRTGPDGFMLPNGETMGFADRRIRPTPPEDPQQRFHLCTVAGDPKGRALCLFVPQGGA